MSDNICREMQLLAPDAIIELFELEINNTDTVLRFHAGTNAKTGVNAPIKFGYASNGDELVYEPVPIKADGFKKSGEGTLPRPNLTVSNVLGIMTGIAFDHNDLVGSKVRRIRTFKKFLNPSNFVEGNLGADPEAKFPVENYVIERKVKENRHFMEFELAVPWDMQGTKLPRRQMLSNLCPFEYKGDYCQYSGPPVADANDKFVVTAEDVANPTGSWVTSKAHLDVCGKRLSSCKLRFEKHPINPSNQTRDFSDPAYGREDILNFGGFPGVGRVLG